MSRGFTCSRGRDRGHRSGDSTTESLDNSVGASLNNLGAVTRGDGCDQDVSSERVTS